MANPRSHKGPEGLIGLKGLKGMNYRESLSLNQFSFLSLNTTLFESWLFPCPQLPGCSVFPRSSER